MVQLWPHQYHQSHALTASRRPCSRRCSQDASPSRAVLLSSIVNVSLRHQDYIQQLITSQQGPDSAVNGLTKQVKSLSTIQTGLSSLLILIRSLFGHHGPADVQMMLEMDLLGPTLRYPILLVCFVRLDFDLS